MRDSPFFWSDAKFQTTKNPCGAGLNLIVAPACLHLFFLYHGMGLWLIPGWAVAPIPSAAIHAAWVTIILKTEVEFSDMLNFLAEP